MAATERLIVALDVPGAREAFALVDKLGDSVCFYKVGMQLYFAEGNSFVRALQGRQKKIFLDLKINDIPETVGKAVASVSGLGVDYLTLFTGGAQIEAARAELKKSGSAMKLLNVTVLTSEASDLSTVKERAEVSLSAGAHGLICSGRETAALRSAFGKDAILVNPGIRTLSPDPSIAGKGEKESTGDKPRTGGSESPRRIDAPFRDDQVRIVTPAMAIRAGATNLVVGRPITRAENPRAAAEKITAEILAAEGALP